MRFASRLPGEAPQAGRFGQARPADAPPAMRWVFVLSIMLCSLFGAVESGEHGTGVRRHPPYVRSARYANAIGRRLRIAALARLTTCSRDAMFRCACRNTDRIMTSSFDACIQSATGVSGDADHVKSLRKSIAEQNSIV
ncbi:hypothetical protein [Burkholderia multivorans]|uniref:hypothetical protein n=1 Tax=Burkholderia multivorans TaxID=87883 RepID=UPI0000E90586|nr:hypothetical protein [Burkholderia multivorans]